MQHVSHFSHFGLVAFDLFLLLGRFDNRRSGFVPITGNVVAGHSASGRAVRNPMYTKNRDGDDEKNANFARKTILYLRSLGVMVMMVMMVMSMLLLLLLLLLRPVRSLGWMWRRVPGRSASTAGICSAAAFAAATATVTSDFFSSSVRGNLIAHAVVVRTRICECAAVM